MSQPPMISGYDSYQQAIASIVEALHGDPGRARFVYNDYSAFDVRITRHLDGAYALTVGYTNRPAMTVVWWPMTENPGRCAQGLGLNAGHDTDTMARLLREIGARLTNLRLEAA